MSSSEICKTAIQQPVYSVWSTTLYVRLQTVYSIRLFTQLNNQRKGTIQTVMNVTQTDVNDKTESAKLNWAHDNNVRYYKLCRPHNCGFGAALNAALITMWVSEWVSSVLRPRQHSIGYMGDGFYRAKDPTNSIKVQKDMLQKKSQTT